MTSTSSKRPVDGYKTDDGLYPNPGLDASLIQFKEAILENTANSTAPSFTIQSAVGELIRVSITLSDVTKFSVCIIGLFLTVSRGSV